MNNEFDRLTQLIQDFFIINFFLILSFNIDLNEN
jgi:hypothetical protein